VPAAASTSLNERQRAYLLAIFETDQELEAEMRDLPYRPFQPRPKASERGSACSSTSGAHSSRNAARANFGTIARFAVCT
jgi:hypothetical protein